MGTPDEPDPGETGGELPGSVCPSCRPMAGGQTSDFSGLTQLCEWVESAPDSAAAERFELDQIADQLSASLELPLLWGAPAFDGMRPHASAATGETVVTLAFELEPFRHFTSAQCDERVIAPVRVTFATADGQMRGVMQGKLERELVHRRWDIFAEVDLSEVDGTLEPEVDTTRIHEGLANAVIRGSELGIRGVLRAGLLYYPDEEAYAHRNDETDTPSPRERVELAYGWFPEDGCGDEEFAVPSDEPSSWLAQRSPAEIVEQASALIAAQGAFDAKWRDGSETSVTIELTAPGERTCISSGEGAVSLGLQSSARIQTADGHVDVAAPSVKIRTLVGSEVSVHRVISFARLESGTPSELAAFGMRDLDLGGRSSAGAMVEAWHYFDDSGDTSGGRIDIFDATTFDHLTWPVGAAP